MIAELVKKENQEQKTIKISLRENTFTKNKEIIEKIAKERQQKDEKLKNIEEDKKTKARTTYSGKMQKEADKIDELSEKCKELEKVEAKLLEKLSHTQSIHRAKINELEKAFNLKVTLDEPIALPEEEPEEGEERGEEEEGEAEEKGEEEEGGEEENEGEAEEGEEEEENGEEEEGEAEGEEDDS
jgi:hypothetical protein